MDADGPVIIAGIGRFGQIVNRMVRNSGYETVVLDSDLRMIQLMRKFGFKGFFGDPTRPEILHAAGLHEASVLVVAIDDKEAAERRRQSRGLTLCNTCLCKSGHARVAGHSSLYNTQRRGGP